MVAPNVSRRILPVLMTALTAALAGAQTVEYGRDVRPILADHCFACHGPDEGQREAKLRLDRRADAIADRDDYAVIVPGDLDASELILRIVDESDPMPPADEHDALSAEEIAVLKRWVEQGAPYGVHWAYEAVESQAPPAVQTAEWARTSVDAFVQARLEAAQLLPAPRSDARTLVRRLSYDLLGLPPTPEQVASFVADPGPAAWDALVEELLESKHHAERLTTFWFDLVRFADTIGIHADNPWKITPYRDWVLDAFRRNMPFDQFTVAQVAGDLLENPTLEQQVAAAYNRLNLITREGGSQPKEFLVRYTADRVRNLSEVWLATTLGCAECHDHKFDPLTTREFYEFGAFFADIEQVGVYSAANTFLPELEVPTTEQVTKRERLKSELAAVEAILGAETSQLADDRRAWESQLTGDVWIVPASFTAEAEGDTALSAQRDGSILAIGGEAQTDTYTVSFPLPQQAVKALRLEMLPDSSLSKDGPGRSGNGNIVLTEFEVTLDGEAVALAASRASYEQKNYPIAQAHDGKRDKTGWAVMKGNAGTPAEAVFELATALPAAAADDSRRVQIKLHQGHGSRHTLGRLRISWTAQADQKPFDPEMRRLLAIEPVKRDEKDQAEIRKLHRAQTPLLASQRTERKDLIAARDAHQRMIPLVLKTKSGKTMVTRILPRGNWMDDSGAVVSPGVPAAFGLPIVLAESEHPRLALANWLVDPNNPLVARVLVNRLWRMLLGRGIANTLDDFGVQGAEPTHPELLDHLAAELVTSGWDIRHVIRLIVRSSTYAQVSSEDRADDPGNRLFGRQDRFRIDAEFVRDNALAISGLLVRDFAGPSVRPYQPAGYYAHLNFPKRTYQVSKGDDLYRRSVYSHWQRQYLHPSLVAFDAPSRERCTAERPRSNTPQAALALLNDPIFVEAARTLAQVLLQEAGDGVEERVTWLWQRVLQRDPRPAEKQLIGEIVAAHSAHYEAHPSEAVKLISVGASGRDESLNKTEHAAWTSAARVAFNLHETIVRN